MRLFLVSYKAKNRGIAIAMTRFFNEVGGKKKPSSNVKINLSDYLNTCELTKRYFNN